MSQRYTALHVTVQPFGCPVTESGHFEFCLRQKDRILCRIYAFVRTLQQVQSPELNYYFAYKIYIKFSVQKSLCDV